MLKISIPTVKYFDDRNNLFFTIQGADIELEHSLSSLYTWESKWNKPFIGDSSKTLEECIDYIRCMTLTPNVDQSAYTNINQDILDSVDNYIKSPMTATWFKDDKRGSRNYDIITAEIIYYWMVAHRIPFVCDKWHLNRLIALIRVCDEKNAPKKKMKKSEVYSRNRALNAARRNRLNSSG